MIKNIDTTKFVEQTKKEMLQNLIRQIKNN